MWEGVANFHYKKCTVVYDKKKEMGTHSSLYELRGLFLPLPW